MEMLRNFTVSEDWMVMLYKCDSASIL